MGLKKLVMLADLSSANPELLSAALNQVETVELEFTHLNSTQITAICTGMTEHSFLKSLRLGVTSGLSDVHSCILAEAITHLVDLNLESATTIKTLRDPPIYDESDIVKEDLTPQQIEAMFTALDTTNQLKRLHIGKKNLTSLNPHLMARVVNKLQEVDLSRAHITSQQFIAICTKMIDDSNESNLKILNLHQIKGLLWFSMPDPGLLGQAIAQLEKVILPCSLSPELLLAIFTYLDMPTSNLKILNMSGNSLSSLDSHVMANVISKLEVVNLDSCHVPSVVGASAIFAALDMPTSKLRSLSMRGNNLADVDARLLANAVNKLETVDILDTNLTSHQITHILGQSLVDTTSLRELRIQGDESRKERRKRKKLLARARRVIPVLEFSYGRSSY